MGQMQMQQRMMGQGMTMMQQMMEHMQQQAKEQQNDGGAGETGDGGPNEPRQAWQALIFTALSARFVLT